MGRTACTEPQCLYSKSIPLLPLWVVGPVQNLSVCTRVTFSFTFTFIPLSLHAVLLIYQNKNPHLQKWHELDNYLLTI
jgi:hypothetical protein